VEVLGFVLENTKDLQLLVQAHSYLIKIQIQKQNKGTINYRISYR
jgi:hypothetical protein